jgi:non-specific serine/threonine protein kinase
LLQEIHANRDLASVYHNLGHACLHLDDLEKATALFQDSMILHQEQGNEAGMTECLLGFAALAIVSELPGAGARLLATAANIGGGKITGEWASTSMTYEYYLDLAQTNLSAPVFQKEQAAGKRLSLNEAVALAEEVVMRTTSSRQTHEKLDQLTPREREVAIMIAKGKTNEEIADGLVLSKRTVEKHIAHIRSKLGVTERTKIVRWVIESGPSDLRS